MPLAIPSANLLFLHIPKTGGNWIREVCYELDIETEEIEGSEEWEHTRNIYPKLERFTIVRRPLAWYASYWANVQIFGVMGLACLEVADVSPELLSFPQFIERVIKHHPGALTRLYKKYVRPGTIVLHTEHLNREFGTLLHSRGVLKHETQTVPFPPENTCASRDSYLPQVLYPPKLADQLCLAEANTTQYYQHPHLTP